METVATAKSKIKERPQYSGEAYRFWELHRYGSLDAAVVMMNELRRMRFNHPMAVAKRERADA